MPAPAAIPAEARAAILAWYGQAARPLAFRRTRDPYAILVAEVMAQQTQADRAAAYWQRFMTHFPTVGVLAAATPAGVLRVWQGLGYDRRAVGLWRMARIVVDTHGGRIPSTVTALEGLPGVGPYTARAVAAFAFGLPVGAVDVNVRRVLSRIVAATGSMGDVAVQATADASVPVDRPGEWTHALMDLGATICRARAPRCPACPAQSWCAYAAAGGVAGPTARHDPGRHAVREPAAPFASTNRWLRGRILDRLRAEPDRTWVTLDEGIGEHGVARVREAATRMAADGVIELQADAQATDPLRARLPLA